MNSDKPNSNLFRPLIIGIAIALGIFIGSGLSKFSSRDGNFLNIQASDKIQNIIQYIQKEYVDTVDVSKIEEDAISSLLEQLDPHSSYLPARELSMASEQLEGNFDGIGVEFNIQKDTIMVVAAISGGPSEALGIHSGDRIVSVENKTVAGIGIKSEDVIKLLRGKSGTKVRVGVFRPGQKRILDYTITRGKIPLHSLDAHFMLAPEIGYIRINRFSATTMDEYKKAFAALKKDGLKKLILDLRDNPGGYLNAAVELSDEFLSEGKKIVYTQGKARKREDYNATTEGQFENGNLAILIDEGSASAAEIVSGAVQDNDRGWIFGRQSFGKGLVQEEVKFDDGSGLRLTVARYYTPSGRCIQKPYHKSNDEYFNEISDRLKKGKLMKPDSAPTEKLPLFKTLAGRKVYGSGGIQPDVFIPMDTSSFTDYLSDIYSKGLLSSFTFYFVDGKRKELINKYKNIDFFIASFNPDQVLSGFYAFTEKNGVKQDPVARSKSSSLIKNQIKAMIARILFGNDGYYKMLNQTDQTVIEAIKILKSNQSVISQQKGKNK